MQTPARRIFIPFLFFFILTAFFSGWCLSTGNKKAFLRDWVAEYRPTKVAKLDAKAKKRREEMLSKLADAALERTTKDVTYDGRFVKMEYPGGDVPAHIGVCTDLVVRAYRKLGVDLQVDVHEDMAERFSKYPQWYSDKEPNTSIDHRRVPNMMVLFKRYGVALSVTRKREDYKPGDIVIWQLWANMLHIGIVTKKKNAEGHYLMAHNIGEGPKAEDFLFYKATKIIGHYRYYGK